MQQGYFSRSWAAVKSTPHWVRKMMVLALVSLIPIFGPIVVGGYLWGWARDAAWGVENPMPEHVFGNEDGHLYSRGFFAFVISFLVSLVPSVVSSLAFNALALGAMFAGDAVQQVPIVMGFGAIGSLAIGLAAFVLSVAIVPVSFVAIMRMSIYTTFSSAFSLRRIWAMVKRDAVGLIKIFAMDILLSIAVSLALGAVMFILILCAVMLMGVMAIATVDASSVSTAFGLMGAGLVILVLFLAAAFASSFGFVAVQAIVARAMGYWTAQFDVPLWRGQSDPMPFEAAM